MLTLVTIREPVNDRFLVECFRIENRIRSEIVGDFSTTNFTSAQNVAGCLAKDFNAKKVIDLTRSTKEPR